MRHASAQRKRGFTLVELMVTCAASSLLLLGMASAVVLTSRALPDETRVPTKILAESRCLEALLADLQYARYITERGAHAISFVVADRDNDGSVERIRYAWSGTPGDPLTREYNGGTATSVLNDVRQFDLTYVLTAFAESYPGPLVETAEVQFAARPTTASGADYSIKYNKWIAQYLSPPTTAVVPADSVSWRLTRVQFYAQRDGAADSQTRMQARTANTDYTPTSTILGEQILTEASLGTAYAWKEAAFANVRGLRLDQGVCFVLQHDGGNPSAQIRFDNAGGSGRVTTSNGGSSWTYDSAKSMLYYAYGTAMIPGTPQSLTRQYVASVGVTVRAGADSGAQLSAAARMFNAPEVLSAVWEQEFAANPTTTDTNGDGTSDWRRRDGQPFNTATLVSGIWQADATLDTAPNSDFTTPVTVEVRFRNTSIGGDGAVFWINADWSGSTFAPLFATLQLQANSTQTLTVYHKQDSATRLALVTVTGLPADFVTLRLLIDPGLNTINVRVNGIDKGTYTYNSIAVAGSDKFATVLPSGSNAEFDYVRVRVGG